MKSSGTKERLTPDEKIISSDFEKNAGRLPWPTQRGIITGQYVSISIQIINQLP